MEKKRPNPPSAADVIALREAKEMRALKYEQKAKSILRMLANDVPKSEIRKALRVSDKCMCKVIAQAEAKT